MKVSQKTKPEAEDKSDPCSSEKSTDVNKFVEYLNHILDQYNKEGSGRNRSGLRGEESIPQHIDMSEYLQRAFFETRDIDVSTSKPNLAKFRDIDFLLLIANLRDTNGNKYNDTLVDEARVLLPSLARRFIANTLLQEAQRREDTSSNTTCEAGEKILLWLSEEASRGSGGNDMFWGPFLSERLASERLCIFKHLIKIGATQCISSLNSKAGGSTPDFPSGLEFLLKSEDSVDGLVLLLQDEVKRAENQPGSFFFTTELGSLLSLKASPLKEIENLLEIGNTEMIENDIDSTKAAVTIIRAEIYKMLTAFATALGNIWTSKNPSNARSLLTWVATVLSSNGNNSAVGYEDKITAAYSLSFCTALMLFWEHSVNSERELEFEHYISDEYQWPLNLKDETLTDYPLGNNGEEKDETNSAGSETNRFIIEELYILCHRAISICYFPAVRKCRQLRNDEKPKETNGKSKLQNLIGDDTTYLHIWSHKERKIHLARFFSKTLLSIRSRAADERKDFAKHQKKVLAMMPASFVSNTTEWIYLLSTTDEISRVTQEDCFVNNCIDFCITLQFRLGLVICPDMALKLVRTLHILAACSDKTKYIVRQMLKEVEKVLSSLLRTYNSAIWVGDDLKQEDPMIVSKVRSAIVLFMNEMWGKKRFERALLEKSQAGFLFEFLENFLEELTLILQGVNKKSEKKSKLQELQPYLTLLRQLSSCEKIKPRFLNCVYTNYALSSSFYVICKASLESGDTMSVTQNKELLAGITDALLRVAESGFSWLHWTERHPEFKSLVEDPILNSRKFPQLKDFFKNPKEQHSQVWENVTQEHTSRMAGYLQTPLDEDSLFSDYHKHLNQVRLETSSLTPSHAFEVYIYKTTSESWLLDRLAREMQQLKRTMPFSLSDVAFVVVDRERKDALRCGMSGPVGTPYSRGLFVFDIFCPPAYPSHPPDVEFSCEVDGVMVFNSSVRSNYVDMPALARAHGCEKGYWSLGKVLHLIRSMMLLPHTEADREGLGSDNVKQHRHCKLRTITVRLAMLQHLQRPPQGLEKVVRLYFTVQRQALQQQCARWAQDFGQECRLKYSVEILLRELQALGQNAVEA